MHTLNVYASAFSVVEIGEILVPWKSRTFTCVSVGSNAISLNRVAFNIKDTYIPYLLHADIKQEYPRFISYLQ